eukprot:scaffold3261_cov67-Phaeocystis_antarctica.AAC.15
MPLTGRTPSSARNCGGQRRAASARRAMVPSCASSPPTSSPSRLCSSGSDSTGSRVGIASRARLSRPIRSGTATSMTSPRQSSPSLASAGGRAQPMARATVPLPSYSEGNLEVGGSSTTCSMADAMPCIALHSCTQPPNSESGSPPALIERDISSIGASSLPATSDSRSRLIFSWPTSGCAKSTEPDG